MPPTRPPPLSPGWSLFLDVDGTLIELTDNPFESQVDEELKHILKCLAVKLHGALALVSGRSIDRLDQLFAPLSLTSSGLHGLEQRMASERTAVGGIDPLLDAARATLESLVAAHAGTLLEDKGRTLAIHYRMAPQFEAQVRTATLAVAANLGDRFHVQEGSMMLEIKPRGVSKGSAIEEFMRAPPFAGRTPVFVGDDLTDLDGFRAVEKLGGISVGVGERVRGQCQLDDPSAVRRWLQTDD